MSVMVMICGGHVEAHYQFRPMSTVEDVKAQIQSDYGVPISRQSLRRQVIPPANSPAGGDEEVILEDGRTLESYGLRSNEWARLDLDVASARQGSVLVVVTSPAQLPGWKEEIRCRETETVRDFKEKIAYRLPGTAPGDMVLRHRGTVMRSGNDAVIKYLVTDGSRLVVEFLDTVAARRPRF